MCPAGSGRWSVTCLRTEGGPIELGQLKSWDKTLSLFRSEESKLVRNLKKQALVHYSLLLNSTSDIEGKKLSMRSRKDEHSIKKTKCEILSCKKENERRRIKFLKGFIRNRAVVTRRAESSLL